MSIIYFMVTLPRCRVVAATSNQHNTTANQQLKDSFLDTKTKAFYWALNQQLT